MMTRRTLLSFCRRTAAWCLACAAAYPILSFLTWKKSASRTVVFTPEEQADHAFKQGVFLIREHGELHALSARCTHLCCLITYSPATDTFRCPCHRSEFDKHGIPVKGPAVRPLERLSIKKLPNNNLEVLVPV